MNLFDFAKEKNASNQCLQWLLGRTVREAYKNGVPVGSFLWLAGKLPSLIEVTTVCGFKAADIAVRKYAPISLEDAFLKKEAGLLRSLSPIVDPPTADIAEIVALEVVGIASLNGGESSWLRTLCAAKAAKAASEGRYCDAASAAWMAEKELLAICRERIPLDTFLEALRKEGVSDE